MRVVVTGGAGALGAAVAARFAADGADVHLTALPSEGYDGPGTVHRVDLRDLAALRAVAAEIGAVQGVIACAGGFGMQSLVAMDAAALDRQIDLNLRTAANTLAAFGDRLDGGAVVLIGARTWSGAAGVAAYAASKAAVVSLGRSASLEWRGRVRVNTLLPDILDTPANRTAMPDADFRRWTPPEAIARVARWLVSDDAAIVTGNAIEVGR